MRDHNTIVLSPQRPQWRYGYHFTAPTLVEVRSFEGERPSPETDAALVITPDEAREAERRSPTTPLKYSAPSSANLALAKTQAKARDARDDMANLESQRQSMAGELEKLETAIKARTAELSGLTTSIAKASANLDQIKGKAGTVDDSGRSNRAPKGKK